MGFVQNTVLAVGKALEKVRAGADKLASRRVTSEAEHTLDVASPDFSWGAELPISATVDGAGFAPTIAWKNVPRATASIVVLCEDPDAPFPEPFVHWMLFGIPAIARSVGDGVAYHSGRNSKLQPDFTPAAPPRGHGLHHYHFQVFALDCPPQLEDGAGRAALLHAMRGHVLAWGEVVGTYRRT